MSTKAKVLRIVFGALFILSGISAIGKQPFWVILVCVAIGAALIPWTAFRRGKPEDVTETEEVIDETPEEGESPEEVAKSVALIGQTCRYSYERVGLYRPEGVAPMPPLGTTLLLEREEDNPYDPKTIRAVKLEAGGVKVYGYMNKGKLRDMVSDFLDRNEPVLTKVTRADDKLEIWIGMS